MATQAKAMDLLRVDYDKLQVEVSRLSVEKEALEKQVVSGDAAIEELEKEKKSLIQEMADPGVLRESWRQPFELRPHTPRSRREGRAHGFERLNCCSSSATFLFKLNSSFFTFVF